MSELTDTQLLEVAGGTDPETVDVPTFQSAQPDTEDPQVLQQVADGTYERPGKYKNPFTAPFQLIMDQGKIGYDTGVSGFESFRIQNNRELSDEEELRELSKLDSPEMQKLRTDANKMNEYIGGWNFFNWAGSASNLGGTMIPTLEGAGEGALVGGVAGAIGGGLTTKTPAGVLSGARIGAGMGGEAGMAAASVKMNIGLTYKELRQQGISRGTANNFATGAGTLMGLLETFGIKGMGAVGRKAFAKQLNSPQGKAALQAAMKELAPELRVTGSIVTGAAGETVTEVGQDSIALTAEALATLVDSEGSEKLWEDENWREKVREQLVSTAIETSKGSLFLAGSTHAAGDVAGRGLSTIKGMVYRAQIEQARSDVRGAEAGIEAITHMEFGDIMRLMKDGMVDKEQNELNDQIIQEMQSETDGAILDELVKESSEGDSKGEVVKDGDKVLIKLGIQETEVLDDQQSKELPDESLFTEGELDQAADSDVSGASRDVRESTGSNVDDIGRRDALAGTPLGEKRLDTGDTSTLQQKDETGFEGLSDEDPEPRLLNPVESQARINTLNQESTQLKRRQLQLEKVFNQKEETNAPRKAILQRLEKIWNRQEQINVEKSMIAENLLNVEDVATAKGTIRMSVLSKQIDRLKNEVNKRVKDRQKFENRKSKIEGKGFSKGKVAERAAIKSLQRDLEKIVNQATGNSAFRNKLKTYISKVTTPKQFKIATKRIQKELQRLEQKRLDKQVSKTKQKIINKIDRMIRDRTKIVNGHPVSQLDADTVARLERFRQMAAVPLYSEGVMNDFFKDYGQLFTEGQLQEIPDEALEQYNDAVLAHDLDNRGLMELNIIAGNVAQWLADAKQKMLDRKAEIKEKREKEIADAKESLGVDEDVMLPESLSKMNKRFFEAAQAGFQMWNTLLHMISPQDPSHKIADMMDNTRAKRDDYSGRDFAIGTAMQQLQEILGKSQTIGKYIFEATNTLVDISYIDGNGKQISLTLDKAQILSAWVKMMDTSIHDSMKDTETGNAWTFEGDVAPGKSFQEAVESVLDETDVNIGLGLLNFYKDYHSRFNGVYRQKYGVDLPQRENYSPLSRAGYKVDPGNEYEFFSLLPKAGKSRTNNLLKVELTNPFADLKAHVNTVEHFISHEDITGTMRNVFGNPEIRKHIQKNYGTGTLNVIDKYIERFVTDRPTTYDQTEGWLALLESDLTVAALGFKPIYQFLVQATAGIAMAANYDPIAVLKGAASYMRDIGKTESAFRTSPILAERFKGAISHDLEQSLSLNGVGLNFISALAGVKAPTMSPEAYKAYTGFVFAGIKYGDAAVTRMFGGPIYHAEIAAGKSPEEALLKVEQLMEQTQQGAAVDQMPHAYANNRFIYFLLGKFRLQPLQLANLTSAALRDFTNSKKTPKDWAEFTKKAAMLWFIPGFLYGAAKSMPMWFFPPNDDDDRDKEVLIDLAASTVLGPLNAVPFAGDLIEMAWWSIASKAFGIKEPGYLRNVGKNPVLKILYEDPKAAFTAIGKAFEAEDDIGVKFVDDGDSNEKLEKMQKALQKTNKATGQLVGAPVAALEMPANVQGSIQQRDYLGALFGLGGWPGSRIRKRESSGEEDGFVDAFVGDEVDDENPFADFFGAEEEDDTIPEDVEDEDSDISPEEWDDFFTTEVEDQ